MWPPPCGWLLLMRSSADRLTTLGAATKLPDGTKLSGRMPIAPSTLTRLREAYGAN